MKKHALLVLSFVLVAAVAACTNNSTAPDDIARPALDATPDSSEVTGGVYGGGWGGSGG